MNDLRERYEARKANFERIIANKTPTTLEHLILNAELPEDVRESLIKDYNQMYYNSHKENKTTRSSIANENLLYNIGRTLRSWKIAS